MLGVAEVPEWGVGRGDFGIRPLVLRLRGILLWAGGRFVVRRIFWRGEVEAGGRRGLGAVVMHWCLLGLAETLA